MTTRGDRGEAALAAVPLDRWHGEPPAVWAERWGVPRLRIFRSVGSTNDVARALAESGAPAGTVVIADEQTAGRGRQGRPWLARAGQSLLLSVLLRPRRSLAPVLPLRIGLAAARALRATAGVQAMVKWPNDLMAGGRKLGGVLCEAATAGDHDPWIIAGIGINVLQEDADWPPELRGLATSAAAAAGTDVAIPLLAGRLVSEVSIATATPSPDLSVEELRDLEALDALRGREVIIDGLPAGRAAGIDPGGALLVERDGTTRRIITGTVRPTPSATGLRSDEE